MLSKLKKTAIWMHMAEMRQIGCRMWLRNLQQRFLAYLRDIQFKLSNLSDTNLALAIHHFNCGNTDDAILRFRMVKRIWHRSEPEIDYYLGRLYVLKLKYDVAIPHLRAYLASDHSKFAEEALFCLRIATNDCSQIDAIPSGISHHTFVSSAGRRRRNFHGTTSSEQRLAIIHSLQELLPYLDGLHHSNVLELGCSTGSLGLLLREHSIANLLIGLDIAPQKIAEAKQLSAQRGSVIYNELVAADFNQGITARLNFSYRYDVIIISEVFNYLSDPQQFLSELPPAAVIIICLRSDNGLTSRDFNRYREDFTYSSENVQTMLQAQGWRILKSTDLGPVIPKSPDIRQRHLVVACRPDLHIPTAEQQPSQLS